jgi:chromosome segregation ATPase
MQKIYTLEQENLRLGRQLETVEAQVNKYKGIESELLEKYNSQQTEISYLKKDYELSSKSQRDQAQESQSKDIRYNRLNQELEKLKQQMYKNESEFKDKIEVVKKTSTELFLENKKLNKQKGDLLNGFKKQNQLIEVLKRQIVRLY